MRKRYAVAAAIAVVIVPVGISLASSERRVIATNTIAPLYGSVNVYPGDRACERIRHLPEGAARVRLRAELTETVVEGSEPSASIRGIQVVLSDRGGRIASGSVRGFEEGEIEVPLSPETRRAHDARLCVRNLDHRLLALFGEEKKPFRGAPPEKRVDRFAVAFLQAEPTSRLARAGTVMKRFEFGHGGVIGGWALWLSVVLALAVTGLSLWLVTRQLPPR